MTSTSSLMRLLLTGFLAAGLCGCGQEPRPATSAANTPQAGNGAGHSDDHDHEHEHEHASVGPHGGTLIELGDAGRHAELTHTDAEVTVFLLDETAKVRAPIDAADVKINVASNEAPSQFTLTAMPEDGEAEGQSSRFHLQSADLATALDDHRATVTLSVRMNGTQYRGRVPHSHGDDDDHSDGGEPGDRQ